MRVKVKVDCPSSDHEAVTNDITTGCLKESVQAKEQLELTH
jgi:hypothetical protein